jgi:hypothetical protein
MILRVQNIALGIPDLSNAKPCGDGEMPERRVHSSATIKDYFIREVSMDFSDNGSPQIHTNFECLTQTTNICRHNWKAPQGDPGLT